MNFRKPLIECLKARMVVHPKTRCWVWVAHRYLDGYGEFRRERAHRISYRAFNGTIPVSNVVCHTCDNRACINPEHLVAGTQRENIQDMHKKGRGRKPMNYGSRKKFGLKERLSEFRQQSTP